MLLPPQFLQPPLPCAHRDHRGAEQRLKDLEQLRGQQRWLREGQPKRNPLALGLEEQLPHLEDQSQESKLSPAEILIESKDKIKDSQRLLNTKANSNKLAV